MRKILIFGNSGSGKSTLAKKLCADNGLSHLDLDSLAWQLKSPPQRRSILESQIEINKFIDLNDGWVIEGCYTDLLELAAPESNELIYMNLPIDSCISNAKNRPWEPHKYESKEAQDANLTMLIGWIAQYSERIDAFSETTHKTLYAKYPRKKSMRTGNE